MTTYTVHKQPDPPADRVDRAEALEFVKDGFSWLTAICPPIGFIAERLWIPLAIYLVALTVLLSALAALGAPADWLSLLAIAINVYLGFELSSLKRWMLERQGWTTLGSVTGSDLGECERRFFEKWLPAQPAVAAAPRPTSPNLKSKFGGLWPFAAKG